MRGRLIAVIIRPLDSHLCIPLATCASTTSPFVQPIKLHHHQTSKGILMCFSLNTSTIIIDEETSRLILQQFCSHIAIQGMARQVVWVSEQQQLSTVHAPSRWCLPSQHLHLLQHLELLQHLILLQLFNPLHHNDIPEHPKPLHYLHLFYLPKLRPLHLNNISLIPPAALIL